MARRKGAGRPTRRRAPALTRRGAKPARRQAAKKTRKKRPPRKATPRRTRPKVVRKPARKVARKPVRTVARKTASKPVRKAARKPVRKVVRKAVRKAVRPRAVRRPAGAASSAAAAQKTASVPAPARQPSTARARRPAKRAPLDRERRRLPDDERLGTASHRTETEVRAQLDALVGPEPPQPRLGEPNQASPVLTADDVDAKWQDAYAVGDEAPGGDNPTPDQDRVEDIGKALGVTYREGEELRASDKIADRDRHRWELDPASSDDWPHGKPQKD